LNDRYSKDESIFNRVIATPSRGFSRLHWSKYLKSLRPKGKVPLATKGPALPSKNIIVVDIAPSGQIDVDYITDVVNFLLAAHSKLQFGESPEIVLLVESPGGGVSKFGLAAAQVGRLRQTGLNVTVCVDEIAASGGYMIASQATKLLAAPFAQLGSIGVMLEGLNFNKLLTKYGVTPMVLKAGESKNRLSAFGEVTEADLEDETKRLESIHQAFIDMCLAQRPELDPSICDGTVMVASQGIQHGIVDRVLTSEEYIWESIANGAHVLKLRRASDVHPNFALFQVLNLLPHLKQKLRKLETGKLLSVAIQGVALVQMILQSRR
jgi:serine protease SohB